MPTLKTVPIAQISPNPYRGLSDYPWIEQKLNSLMRSIEDVGFWEGVIVRKASRGYELAFGHHRLEAARRLGVKKIPVIIRDLSDEDMLKFMGRENGEDYSTEFLVMLNTWEGAVQYFVLHGAQKPKTVDIARLLGWTRPQPKPRKSMRPDNTADACAAAHSLISSGHLDRFDLEGLSVHSARDIVQQAQSRMRQIEERGEKANRPKQQVEAAKEKISKGAKVTAREVKKGAVAQKDIRSEVDINIYKAAAIQKRKNPLLFETFGKILGDNIGKMLANDASSKKLQEVVKALPQITMPEDAETVSRIKFELEQLGKRTKTWQKRLIPKSKKVVSLLDRADGKEAV